MTSNGSKLRPRCTFESRWAPCLGAQSALDHLIHGSPMGSVRWALPPGSQSLLAPCISQTASSSPGWLLCSSAGLWHASARPVQRPWGLPSLAVPKATCLHLPSRLSCNSRIPLSPEGTYNRFSPLLPVLVLPYLCGPGTTLQRSPL